MANKKFLGIGIILLFAIIVMPNFVSASIPEIKNYATASGTGSIINVPKPADVESGDLIIVIIGTRDGGSLEAGTGFNLIRHEYFSNDKDHPITASWYKIASVNEPNIYTFYRVTGDNREWNAISFTIKNYDVNNPIGKTSGDTSGSSSLDAFNLTMFETTRNNSLIFTSITSHEVVDSPFITNMNILHLINNPRPARGTYFEEIITKKLVENKIFTWDKNGRISAIGFEVLSYLEPLKLNINIQYNKVVQGGNNMITWLKTGDTAIDYFEINIYYPNNTLLYNSNIIDSGVTLENLTDLGTYNIEAFVNDTYGNEYFAFESFEVIEGEPQPLSPETMQGIITAIFMTLIIFVLIYFGIKIRSKNVLIMGLIVSIFYGVVMLASGWFWVIGIIFIIVPLILFFEF